MSQMRLKFPGCRAMSCREVLRCSSSRKLSNVQRRGLPACLHCRHLSLLCGPHPGPRSGSFTRTGHACGVCTSSASAAYTAAFKFAER